MDQQTFFQVGTLAVFVVFIVIVFLTQRNAAALTQAFIMAQGNPALIDSIKGLTASVPADVMTAVLAVLVGAKAVTPDDVDALLDALRGLIEKATGKPPAAPEPGAVG
jgi:hypothetical protein